jgi:hypothetical protein
MGLQGGGYFSNRRKAPCEDSTFTGQQYTQLCADIHAQSGVRACGLYHTLRTANVELAL